MSGMYIEQGNQPSAPGVYTDIIPPPPVINGIPSGKIGVVGVASWGNPNSVIIVGSPQEKEFALGLTTNRSFDLGTQIDILMENGANDIVAVRVTDGTDVKATATLMDIDTTPAEGALLTALYSGVVGNTISASIVASVQPSAFKLTISRPGFLTETFDGITGTGSTFWQNLVNAVNNGQGVNQGPSNLVTASLPTTQSTYAPNVTTTYTLSGGTDGTTSITTTMLLGSDGPPRTGLYAMRGTGVQIAFLAECSDSTTFTDQLSFGNQEGCDMIATGPAGEWVNITTAVSNKNAAGVAGHNFTRMLGDWIYWFDQTNQVLRKTSPQAFKAGRLASLGPQNAGTNKRVYGVVKTESSKAGYVYSNADIGTLKLNGIDLICNPIPKGNVFGIRIGVNTSFNAANVFDNYTRLTNYLSRTIDQAVGLFDGEIQTPQMWNDAHTMIDDFLQTLVDEEIIEAYSTEIDSQNNPQSQGALGYMNININITYFGIAAVIVINFNGGTSVVITKNSLASAA